MSRVLRRVPLSLAALLAAVAIIGLTWAVLLPAFQAPDENSHFGYVQTLAETGTLPGDAARPSLSTEQFDAVNAVNSDQVAAVLLTKPEWSPEAAARWLEHSDRLPDRARSDGGGANPASANPPAYYALGAIGYLAADSDDLFGRLLAARLISVLCLLATVCAAWLLIGEAVGRNRQLQLTGASVAGLLPMMTFVSASVTPDALLYALWTFSFWLGVRILRRGLTPAGAAALLAIVGLAIVTKAASYALLPAVALVLIVGALRGRRASIRRVGTALAAAAVALGATAGAWFVIARLSERQAAAQVSATASAPLDPGYLASYVWQFYLPKLPFQTDFPVIEDLALWNVWIKGTWGRFGWLEIVFPDWLYAVLTAIAVVVAAAAIAAIVRRRRRVDWAIVGFFALAAVTLVAGLHWSEFNLVVGSHSGFAQGRYLLPLVGIACLAVALALGLLRARARSIASGALVGGLVVLQLTSLAIVAVRFYA